MNTEPTVSQSIPAHKVIDASVMSKSMPEEVANRAGRLRVRDQNHPLLKYFFTSPEDKDENGGILPEKAKMRLEEFLDKFWDQSLGDRHDWSAEKVAAVVWKNYLAELSEAVPHSFLPRITEMNMKMERFLMGIRSSSKPDKSDCTRIGFIKVDPMTEKEYFVRTYYPGAGKPKPTHVTVRYMEKFNASTDKYEPVFYCI